MSKELWERYFSILESGLNLEPADVAWCMKQILEGNADNELIKKFLLSLKAKGETSEEVGALVAQMYEHSAPISITERAVDTVGTGGDGAHTINISTTAAIIAAAAGAKVVKHGNRAASSKSGAADLLEALGVAVTLDGKGVETTFAQLGIGFCFAPVFHPAMRFAAPDLEDAARLPCLTTLAPAAEAMMAAVVEILIVWAPSPPVPTVSTARSVMEIGAECSYIWATSAPTSSLVSPFAFRESKNFLINSLSALPSRICFMHQATSAGSRSRPLSRIEK